MFFFLICLYEQYLGNSYSNLIPLFLNNIEICVIPLRHFRFWFHADRFNRGKNFQLFPSSQQFFKFTEIRKFEFLKLKTFLSQVIKTAVLIKALIKWNFFKFKTFKNEA